MGKRISDWLRRVSKGWVALSALLIFLLFTALVLPQQAAKAEQETGSADSPDTSFLYSPGDLYQMAEAYGEGGRRAYIRARFTFDLVWPVVYTFFLTTGIGWLYLKGFPQHNTWQRASFIPLFAALCDYLENLSTSLVMARYPNLTPVVSNMAGIFTLVKWLLVSASFGLLLVGVVVVAWRRMRGSGG